MKRKKIIKKLKQLGFWVRKDFAGDSGFITFNGSSVTIGEGHQQHAIDIDDIETNLQEQSK